MDISTLFSKIGINNSFPELSSFFLLGFSIGYFLKKSFKIMLLLLGIIIFILFWFDNVNSIEIVNDSISLNSFLELFKLFMQYIYNKVSNLEITRGVVIIVGFLFGLKLG